MRLVSALVLSSMLACSACGRHEAKPVVQDDENVPLALAGSEAMKVEDWVAGEFKKGGNRWKDVGVYVDGNPVGVLNFGELPVGLKPVWIEDEVSAPKNYGDNSPGYKIVKARRYRFTEYLQAVGVNVAKIKELHVYGPKFTNTIIVSGAELRQRGKDFMFRFGGEVWGKPIPVVPDNFGNGKSPDKLSAVMVYINKTPPVLVRNVGMELNGELITDVPYYGDPMRGGVRIYYDDKFVAWIKRHELKSTNGLVEQGELAGQWSLYEFLKSHGVNTAHIAEGWVVRGEHRAEKMTLEELKTATFEASPQAKGKILLGKDHLPANALALHSKPLKPEQLPQIMPDEDVPDDDEN